MLVAARSPFFQSQGRIQIDQQQRKKLSIPRKGGGKGFQSRLILLGPIPHGAAIKMARKVIDRKIATLASLMRVGS